MVAPVDSDLLTASLGKQNLTAQKDKLQRLDAGTAADKAKLREAVEGFEAIFIQKMWQQMRKGVPKGGMFKSREEQMWQGMYDQELSVKMSQSGGVGLSDMLYDQLAQKLGEKSRSTNSKGGTQPVIRELDSADRLNKIMPVASAQPSAQPAAVTTEMNDMDDFYSPVDEQEASTMTTEEMNITGSSGQPESITIPLVKTNTEFMTDDEAAQNMDALGKQILTGQNEPISDETIIDKVPPVEPRPVPVEQTLAADEDASSTTASSVSKTEATIGVGGPIIPSPDMATINWPLPGPISSNFGWRKDPFTGKRAWHSGVDIAGKTGDSVAAAWDGKVIYAGERKGYGNLVVIEHTNGWRSYYGHNSKLNVSVGDTVEGGKKIAEVGSTGRSTGPHLHFEIRQGELAWNPQQVRSRLMAGLPIGKVS